MSRIDRYSNKLLGFILCDSDYEFVSNNPTRKIAVYLLCEDIPLDEIDFDGKKGDILIGGGSGEAPAFRISNPSAFEYFHEHKIENFENFNQLFKAFWTPTQAFKLCNGFIKSGWNPKKHIELWLAEQICILLSENNVDFSEFSFDGEISDLIFEKISY